MACCWTVLACCHFVVVFSEQLLPGVVTEETLANARMLVSRAKAEGSGKGFVQKHRNFAADHESITGHHVVYLHLATDDGLASIVEHLAELAHLGEERAGWGLLSASSSVLPSTASKKLELRCLEAISYNATGKLAIADRSALGWHHDGHTWLTVMMLLTDPGDFKGGEVEFWQPGHSSSNAYTLQQGDALVWRGWEDHRVRPVHSGVRRALVAEFWPIGSPQPSLEEPRPADYEEGFILALKAQPDSVTLLGGLADMLVGRGAISEAEARLHEALSIKPFGDSSQAHLLFSKLGSLLVKQADLNSARSAYQSALWLAPEYAEKHYDLGVFEAEHGEQHSAEQHYKVALELEPQDARVYAKLGLLLENREGAMDEVEALYQAAISLEPMAVEVQNNLGVAFLVRGELLKAKTQFLAVLALNPEFAQAHHNLAWIYADSGEFDLADESERIALELDQQTRPALVLDTDLQSQNVHKQAEL